MDYAIETLKIELYRLKKHQRIVGDNQDEIMQSISGFVDIGEHIEKIEKAIKILEEAKC